MVRKHGGIKYPEYWIEPRELIDNLWTDIQIDAEDRIKEIHVGTDLTDIETEIQEKR